MPVSGPQQPGFFLPGAEYFSLAPNATVALGGRRRASFAAAVTAIAASSTLGFGSSLLLEQPFPQTAGIYVHRAWLSIFPQDASAQLQIASSFLALNVSSTATALAFPLGIPITTQLAPVNGLISILDRDLLVTWRDIAPMTGFPPAGQPGLLNITYNAAFKNLDATNPHSVQVIGAIIYTRLDGLQE